MPVPPDVYQQMMAEWRAAHALGGRMGHSDTAIAGVHKLQVWSAAFAALPPVIRNHVARLGTRAMAEETRRRMELSMREGKTGTHYPGMSSRSSAPSETPAVQSGMFLLSLKVEDEGRVAGGAARSSLNSRIKYAVALEYGTSKMLPRAPFRRTASRNREAINRAGSEVMLEAVLTFLRGVAR